MDRKNVGGTPKIIGKILIACGDEVCRSKLLNVISGKGLYLNSVWEDADLLLEVLDRDYDVIVYDLDISDFNGLKMVRIIRKIRRKVSLMVISKNPSNELGGKVLQEGIAFHAVKPIDLAEVEEALFTLLN
ncbi:MAG: response regulator [bacterium]